MKAWTSPTPGNNNFSLIPTEVGLFVNALETANVHIFLSLVHWPLMSSTNDMVMIMTDDNLW